MDNFLKFLESAKNNLNIHRKIAHELDCSDSTLNIIDKTIVLLITLEDKVKTGNLKINYINQFQTNVNTILGTLPLKGINDISFFTQQNEQSKSKNRFLIDNNTDRMSKLYHQFEFNLDFFDKIGYFQNNVVAIGANGSGKTTLSNIFKTYLHNNGVVISAQRILLVPNLNSISNPSITAVKLKESQTINKTNKNDGDIGPLQQEFGVVLKNLLAENIAAGNTYRKQAIEFTKNGLPIEKPMPTNLDKTFQIWNSLIEHRIIECQDGINITAMSYNGIVYPAIQMSDGEKVMLYLIGHVLQAPPNGFIVVDEPEMYLHKTILKKLWDILEKERQDCLFIYLTHDLDFATSRTTAKKIWIKSFTHPDKWEIEDIPLNEIPETLLFELLGSRKNILFCEGVKGSIDERIYSSLFSQLTVMPVGSCFDVINHTKAFNRLSNVNTKAFGLIDSDHHNHDRLERIKNDGIFSFSVSEVENLFLDIEFLKILATQLLIDSNIIENIKIDVINELDKLKEIQAANYVCTKINYYFKDSHVSKGNDLAQVELNYKTFTDKITITNWFDLRKEELIKIIVDRDYDKAISVFNNKGLKSIASKHLKISDFIERSVKLLLVDYRTHNVLMKYFPIEIKDVGTLGYN